MRKILVIIICLLCLFYGIKLFRDYTIRHPIKMFHPFPTLTKKIPILKKIDRIFCLTGGFSWYVVKNKETGKDWFVQITENGKIFVMDREYRTGWIEISQDKYLDIFENPVYGEGIR